jgi:hypothetical protein
MKNFYHEYLKQLRSIKSKSGPYVSIYVPLRWSDATAGHIFNSLLTEANELALKGGFGKIRINMPEWDRWIAQGTISLGIFHCEGVTHLVPLSIKIQPRVVVANSFHVKPIIAASMEYVEGLLLHFCQTGAVLYRISPIGESVVERYLPAKEITDPDWPNTHGAEALDEFLYFLRSEVESAKLSSTGILGVTGGEYPLLQNETFWRATKLPVQRLSDPFGVQDPQNALAFLRLKLSQIIARRHLRSVSRILERNLAQDRFSVTNLGEKVIRKEISSLCVSLDDMFFGELDPVSGSAVMNYTQTSMKDDDLLDDIVELALDKGIKVSVVPKRFLPEGRAFIAS